MPTIPDDSQKLAAATPRRRRRFGISVRMLMVLVLVLGCWLGWYVPRVRVQQEAVAAIKDAGGSVSYDWEWGNYNPYIISNGKPRAPEWLTKLVAVDYVANVTSVDLGPNGKKRPVKANDATLAHVGRLRRTQYLSLQRTAITDAGLVHLKDLTGLQQLSLFQTPIGDAGLAHLKRLNKLRLIQLGGKRITDNAVLELERASLGVYIIRVDEESADGKTWQRANDDLEFARSQPIRLARVLLEHRVQSMAQRNDPTEFIATIEALCDLPATDTWTLIKKAESLARCLGRLQPASAPKMPESQRQALERQCADSGVAALTRAVALGYDNARHLDGHIEHMGSLWNLHDHPGIPKLIEAMKARHPGR